MREFIWDFRDTWPRSWSSRRCSDQSYLRESRTSIRRSYEIWLPHLAARRQRRFIRWRKVVYGQYCRKPCGRLFNVPSPWVNVDRIYRIFQDYHVNPETSCKSSLRFAEHERDSFGIELMFLFEYPG